MDLKDADIPWKNPISEDFHVTVYKDTSTSTSTHLLFVPNYNNPEVLQDAFYDAYNKGIKMLANKECDGFNIILDIGTAAGQKIMYPHIRLIPRFETI